MLESQSCVTKALGEFRPATPKRSEGYSKGSKESWLITKERFDMDCDSLQVLAKSCKMVPVMVMGTLIGGKYYSGLEYFCAALIAAGISLFAKQSSKQVVGKLAAPNAPLGYTLCLLNLILDGYTNAKQVQLPDSYFE